MVEAKKEVRPDILKDVRVAKSTAPLADQLRKLAFRVIRMMRITISNFRIYPSGSHIIKASVRNISDILTEHLREHESFTLGEAQGNLLVNGKELERRAEGRAAAIDFAYSLIAQGIKSITFQRGMTQEELKVLLEAMSQPKTKLKDRGGIIQILKKKNVSHIQINETIYVAVVKGDLIIKKTSDLLRQSGSKIEAIVRTLEDSVDMMGEIPDEETKDHVVTQIAKKLAQYKPEVLQEFFEKSLPSRLEELNIKEKILSVLSSEKMEEVLTEISNWYERIRKETTSEEEIAEKVTRLKEFLSHLLTSPEAQKVPDRIYYQLKEKNLVDYLPDWVSEERAEEKASPLFQANLLLKKSSPTLLEKGNRELLLSLIPPLALQDQDKVITDLITKVEENLSSGQARARQDALKVLEGIIDILQKNHKERLLPPIEEHLLAYIEREKDVDLYALLSEILKDCASWQLKNGEYEFSGRVIGLFSRHLSPESKIEIEKRQFIQEKLGEIAQENMPLLMADIKSGDGQRQTKASQVISRLGKAALPSLIQVLKESEDLRSRHSAISLIKEAGEEGEKALLGILHQETSPQELRRIIGILDGMGYRGSAEELRIVLEHPESQVRREAVELLGRLGTEEAQGLLIERMKDGEEAIARKAVYLLGELKASGVISSLLDLIRGKANIEVKKEAYAALEKIGDPKVIPEIIKETKKRKLFIFFWKKDEGLRAMAAWALAGFSASPEAERALQEAVGAKDPHLRKAAQNALDKLKRRK